MLLAAQGLSAQTMPLLYAPADARSASLGGTGVALEADAWAMENNFAQAVISTRHFSIGAAYDRWAPQPAADNRFAAGGWYSYNRFAFGLSAKSSFAPAYEAVSPGGATLDPFQPSDLSAALGLAWSPLPGFSLSAAARLVSSSLALEARATGVCADLGLAYSSTLFRVGLSVANLGGRLRFGSTEAPLPTRIRGGGTLLLNCLSFTVEADYLSGAGLMAGTGIEFRPVPILALRAGYHYGPADKGVPSFGSCGLGLLYKGLGLDVAFLFASPTIGGSLCAGLSYSF